MSPRVDAVADWSGIVVPELSELEQFALGLTIAEVKAPQKMSWSFSSADRSDSLNGVVT